MLFGVSGLLLLLTYRTWVRIIKRPATLYLYVNMLRYISMLLYLPTILCCPVLSCDILETFLGGGSCATGCDKYLCLLVTTVRLIVTTVRLLVTSSNK